MNLKQIKKRVSSVKNIGKITSALEMVAASKVQRAVDKAVAARPYADKVYELVAAMADEKDASSFALMRQSDSVKSDLYILISTNKGLAGSLNTALFGALGRHLKGIPAPHKFVTLGSKGLHFALKNGELVSDFSDKEPFLENIPAMVGTVVSMFTEEKVDKVYLVYAAFQNILSQEPTIKQLLPISKNGSDLAKNVSYTFEPSAREVLESLLVFYIENQIREAIVSAEASEHASRMIAMKAASDNAKELSYTLGLEYNKVRQSAITTEIADVVTSVESLS